MSGKQDNTPLKKVNRPKPQSNTGQSASEKSDLAYLFGSETRAIVLWALLNHPDEGLTQTNIARVTNKDPKEVRRALDNLEQLGLAFYTTTYGGITSIYAAGGLDLDQVARTSAGTRRYRLDKNHPWVTSLRIILENSSLGSIHLLKNEMNAFSVEKVKPHVAFVFGSFAIGEQTSVSDIDLVIIGYHDRAALAEIVNEIELRISRTINYIEYTSSEWANALIEDSDFAASIMAKPKICLIGDNEKLERISKTRESR